MLKQYHMIKITHTTTVKTRFQFESQYEFHDC